MSKLKFQNKINVENRKARFNYELLDRYEAGIQLYGTEIKSIRLGKVSIAESFCQFKSDELYIINMMIHEYDLGTYSNHTPRRERKLLLKRKELNKLLKKTKETGLTIIPLRMYLNDRGLAKITISLAKGKKLYDKREDLKQKDTKRDLDRIKKSF
ncbi:MAG: SsrA-binding protein SmpB [Flavobacteriales bacterium]|nr:SsrA-binding protein SmpB [Flavobacteriales bacterium]